MTLSLEVSCKNINFDTLAYNMYAEGLSHLEAAVIKASNEF